MKFRTLITHCFLILVLSQAQAGPYAKLDSKLKGKTVPEARSIIEQSEEGRQLANNDDSDAPLSPSEIDEIRHEVHLRGLAESAPQLHDYSTKAKEIKRSPLYSDKISESNNWLSRAIARLKDLIPKFNSPKAPNWNVPQLGLAWLTPLMWGLLIIAVLAFAVFAFRHISWKFNLRRSAKALLEDDEPERTLDEWLTQADLLVSQGKYREAVRCLYLACLLRFDEARIAKFDRGQTNWEHLARIEASQRMPDGLDFRTPTLAFDNIWYGFRCRGLEDVSQFKEWYREITAKVSEDKAA